MSQFKKLLKTRGSPIELRQCVQRLHEMYATEDGLYAGFKERRGGDSPGVMEEEMIAIPEVTTRL